MANEHKVKDDYTSLDYVGTHTIARLGQESLEAVAALPFEETYMSPEEYWILVEELEARK